MWGIVENDGELLDLFAKVVCFVLDNETLRDRLLTRTTRDYGKGPNQLEVTLRRNASFERPYRRCGALILDASRPLDVVVDKIIAASIDLSP